MGVKPASRRLAFRMVFICIAGGVWEASQWWEKGLAERLGDPEVSPGGCYRVESFKPFWVLPNIFHRRPDPNEVHSPEWFPWWGYPGFFRLYDHRTEELISETKVHDWDSIVEKVSWGGGSGQVRAGMIRIGPNLPDCPGDVPGKMRREQ